MRIQQIKYISDNGWENETFYNATPSSDLHIPRIGETVVNTYGDAHEVVDVIWDLPKERVIIKCELNVGYGKE